MDVVTKATGTVTPVEDSKSKHGEFDVILSTNALDRDGDELHADEWKTPLPDRITFDSDHGMSVATCVGSGKPFINDQGQLQVRGTYASTPHGQAVRTLVNEKHITNVSVAFMNHKTQKSGKPLRELLNGAFVAVPANPEAIVLSSKAAKDADGDDDHNSKEPYGDVDYADPGTTDAMGAVSDMFENDPLDSDERPQRKEYWQGVHDVAVKLGAGCPYSDPQATADVLNVSNRSIDDAQTKSGAYTLDDFFEFMRQRMPSAQVSPTESADKSAAADQKSAAADESADDVARAKALLITLADID